MAGCSDKKPVPVQGAVPADSSNAKLISYEDKERGVVCYRAYGYEGLSCLKLKLSAKEELEEQMIKEIFQPKGE